MLKAKTSLSSPEFMEEDGEETPGSPFWLQTTTNVSRIQLSSLFFNSVVLIILLLLLAILSMVLVIPNVIDFSSNVFKPNLVKRGWDSINLILVLVALAFGFLGRNINNDEKLSYDRSESELSPGAPAMSPSSSTPQQWYDFPDDQSMTSTSTVGLRRQKASSSYPDLRELSPPWDHHAADPWRFSDDTHLNYYQVLEYSNRNNLRQRSRREQNPGNQGVVDVDAFGGVSQQRLYTPAQKPAVAEEGLHLPPPQPTPPPTLPPQPPAHTVKKKTKRRARSSEPRKVLSPVIDPLPEPSSPPPIKPLTERKTNGGNATKDFFTLSFYHKKKKKRQKERSFDDLQSLLHHSRPPPARFQLPPPSPPPPAPPPPPSVLHKLFPTKKEKQKNITSVTLSPPPRPTRSQSAPYLTDNKPHVASIPGNFTGIEDSSSGGDSPMKQITPPPPPLPPFKVPDWEFAVEGDFVSLQSVMTSRSVSPNGDESRSPSSVVAPPLFCPSPDVDTKADNFIESFRARLKLERMSKLGPGLDSGPSDG